MSFLEAVRATPDISGCYSRGLRAIPQSERAKIILRDTLACEGSVDIDAGVRAIYPNDNRWDYCFSYKGEVFFVEIHPAYTSEVGVVINKLHWLRNWLSVHAPEIDRLKALTVVPFYWVQTGSFHIP